jgi:hypothetical protein
MGKKKKRSERKAKKNKSKKAVHRRPVSHEKLINSIISIKARDRYLQEEGLLTYPGPRR